MYNRRVLHQCVQAGDIYVFRSIVHACFSFNNFSFFLGSLSCLTSIKQFSQMIPLNWGILEIVKVTFSRQHFFKFQPSIIIPWGYLCQFSHSDVYWIQENRQAKCLDNGKIILYHQNFFFLNLLKKMGLEFFLSINVILENMYNSTTEQNFKMTMYGTERTGKILFITVKSPILFSLRVVLNPVYPTTQTSCTL